MKKAINIIIAGGKTGGHLFPGIAVAQALGRLNDKAEVLFVGTDAPFEEKTLTTYGYTHKAIISKPIKGGNIFKKLFSISVIFISLIQSMVIILKYKPDFVLGVGGFSSFAVVLAAWLLGIPTAIQEQNAIPGFTNWMLSKIANTIFTSFETTKGFAKKSKVKFVGNPVRRTESSALKSENQKEKTDSTFENYDPEKFTILVTGGSQGAKSINKAFCDMLETLYDPGRFNLFHQTGEAEEQNIKDHYKKLNINGKVKAFFHNMPQLQKAADLIITRAGAGAISEICVMKTPAVFVPYPYAADDHQTFNAKALEEQGAAIVIKDKELDALSLYKVIQELSSNRELLEKMSEKLGKLAMPDADEQIAKHILRTKDIKA